MRVLLGLGTIAMPGGVDTGQVHEKDGAWSGQLAGYLEVLSSVLQKVL